MRGPDGQMALGLQPALRGPFLLVFDASYRLLWLLSHAQLATIVPPIFKCALDVICRDQMESKDVRILFTALETHSLVLQHACRHQPRQSVLVTVSPESDATSSIQRESDGSPTRGGVVGRCPRLQQELGSFLKEFV
jgi:hypothetical protein